MNDPRLEHIQAKKIIGMHIQTSAANSQAVKVWKKFMPLQKEVQGKEEGVFFSIQDFPSSFSFSTFDPSAKFTTWAAKEILPDTDIPDVFSSTVIKGGQYAVCTHHGAAASIGLTLSHMYGKWIPESGYQIDTERKHFEVLGKEYLGPNNPDSKEQVWIPIKPISEIVS